MKVDSKRIALEWLKREESLMLHLVAVFHRMADAYNEYAAWLGHAQKTLEEELKGEA